MGSEGFREEVEGSVIIFFIGAFFFCWERGERFESCFFGK